MRRRALWSGRAHRLRAKSDIAGAKAFPGRGALRYTETGNLMGKRGETSVIENYLSGGAGIEPVAGALFAVGVMLLILEAVGPGLGAGGFLGAGCALASFLPDALSGSEPLWTVVLAGLGGALMLLDARAAGFGALGWAGLALLIAALGLGAASVRQFLFTLCGAAALSAAALPVALLRLPRSAAMAKIQLDERIETGTGRAARVLPEPGARGRARGDLKPRGTVEIAGERYEARAERFLEKGAAVRVVRREGETLVVEREGTE